MSLNDQMCPINDQNDAFQEEKAKLSDKNSFLSFLKSTFYAPIVLYAWNS